MRCDEKEKQNMSRRDSRDRYVARTCAIEIDRDAKCLKPEVAVWTLFPNCCFRCIRQLAAAIKVGVHQSAALVGKIKHSCIRQLVAATEVDVRQSRALFSQFKRVCIFDSISLSHRDGCCMRKQLAHAAGPTSAYGCCCCTAAAAAFYHRRRLHMRPPPSKHFKRNHIIPHQLKSKCTFLMEGHSFRHRLHTCGADRINVMPNSSESTLSKISSGISAIVVVPGPSIFHPAVFVASSSSTPSTTTAPSPPPSAAPAVTPLHTVIV